MTPETTPLYLDERLGLYLETPPPRPSHEVLDEQQQDASPSAPSFVFVP